jgi:hypothetical protein
VWVGECRRPRGDQYRMGLLGYMHEIETNAAMPASAQTLVQMAMDHPALLPSLHVLDLPGVAETWLEGVEIAVYQPGAWSETLLAAHVGSLLYWHGARHQN